MSTLSTAARNEYYTELAKALPTPVINELEYRERRLATAVEAFEALRPGDAYEGRLAVRIVLCGAHAAECLREADCYLGDYARRTSCRAQAASMMRGENSAKRMLEREQRVRLAAEAVANGAGAQPEGASVPPPQAEPQTPQVQAVAVSPVRAVAVSPVRAVAVSSPLVQTADAASPPTAVPPAVAVPRPAVTRTTPAHEQSGSARAPSPEAIVQAGAFAMAAGVASAPIRRDGGVTPQSKAHFRRVTVPTDLAMIDALVHGSSAALRMPHDVGGKMPEAAD